MRIETDFAYTHVVKDGFDSYQSFFHKEVLRTQWVACKESLDFIYKEIGVCT